jgi:hypothetical protein
MLSPFIVWGGLKELTGVGCSSREQGVLKEFPHYSDQRIEAYSGEVSCNVRYPTKANREEVLGYYDRQLRENGWEVGGYWAADPPKGIEVFGEQLSDILEAPEEGVRSGMGAIRGDYRYGVTYHPPGESSEVSPGQAEVMVQVTDEPLPPGGEKGAGIK